MRILIVTSELVPLASAGGLAEAVASQARAMSALGHDVRVVMPLYDCVKAEHSLLIRDLAVPMREHREMLDLRLATLPNSHIPVYLIDHAGLFRRNGIYGDESSGDFRDNLFRFALLCKASFSVCQELGWIPDVANFLDWPGALGCVYLKYVERFRGFRDCASVLTIHNLGYQGRFDREFFPALGLADGLYQEAGFDDSGSLNLLKAGLAAADKIATVSPSYAREIQTPEYGFRLDGLLRSRMQDLVGILNGIDQDDWDPSKDGSLLRQFSSQDTGGRDACKLALQHEFGLEERLGTPLLAFTSRLVEQKGIRELFGQGYGSAWAMCRDMRLQIVVMSSGEKWCEAELATLQQRLPNLRYRPGYDRTAERRILAGADFLLLPSRYEPCGLTQMFAMRYGCLPIARRTGGLADSIRNYNQDSGEGTGFLLDDLSPRSIYDTVGWAVWAWYNRPCHIEAMRQRAMAQDFSWDESAREYISLYEAAISQRKAREA